MADLLRAAQWYARRGLHVFPVAERGKRPVTPNGCKDATKDPARLAGMWGRSNYNVAICCGPSRLAVIDIDGDIGAESLASLERKYGPLPTTPTALTRRGRHFYCAAPRDIELGNTASKLAPKIDTRAGNGYVLAPPSIHPSGFTYHWAPGRGIHEIALAPLPLWIVEGLAPEPAPEPVELPADGPSRTKWVNTAVVREAEKVRTAGVGTRNRQLRNAAWALGTLCGAGVLDAGLARGALIAAGIECGLPSKEAIRVVNRGVSEGAKNPRELRCG